jgi:hypothetical protein
MTAAFHDAIWHHQASMSEKMSLCSKIRMLPTDICKTLIDIKYMMTDIRYMILISKVNVVLDLLKFTCLHSMNVDCIYAGKGLFK